MNERTDEQIAESLPQNSCVQFALLLTNIPNLKSHTIPEISCLQEYADRRIDLQKYFLRNLDAQIRSEMLENR